MKGTVEEVAGSTGKLHLDGLLRMSYQTQTTEEPVVIGNIIPIGKVWPEGNELPIIFKTPHDIMVGELFVPAGTYSLFFLPLPEGWKLVVSRQVGRAGMVYDSSQDLGRVDMVQTKAADCRVMTLDFKSVPGKSCTGRCPPQDGPYVPQALFTRPLIHFSWREINVYVALSTPVAQSSASVRPLPSPR
jgi:hypothetical protein